VSKYKTGNSRALNFTHTLSGSITNDFEQPGDRELISGIRHDATLSTPLGGATVYHYIWDEGTRDLSLGLDLPFGGISWGSGGSSGHSSSTQHVGATQSCAGTFTVSGSCEEVFEVSGLPIDIVGEPRRKFDVYEQLVVGSSVTLTLTYQGVTLSKSGTVTSPIRVGYNLSASVLISFFRENGRAEQSGSMSGSVSCTMSGAASSAPGASTSLSAGPPHMDGSATCSASASGNTCSVSVSGLDPETFGLARAARTVHPDKPFAVSGSVYRMWLPYDEQLTALVSGVPKLINNTWQASTEEIPFTGSFGGSWTQRSGSSFAQVSYNQTPLISTDQRGIETLAPFSCSLTPASLTARKEDARQTRLRIHDKNVGGLSLSHAQSVTIDDCDDLLTPSGPWAGGWEGDAAFNDGNEGQVGIFITEAGQTARREFTHDVSLGTYRYLRLRLRADQPNQPFEVKIGSKRWGGLSTGAANNWVDIDIDLCLEKNGPSLSTAYTEYPIHKEQISVVGDVTDSLPVGEQPYFGVGRCSAIELLGLAEGVTYSVDRIELRREGPTKLEVLPRWERGRRVSGPFGQGSTIDNAWDTALWPFETINQSETTSDYRCRRMLLALSDKIRQVEEYDMSYTLTTGGQTGVPNLTSYEHPISDVVTRLNASNAHGTILRPGISASASAPAPSDWPGTPDAGGSVPDSYYYCDRLPASCLHGGGLLKTTSGWVPGHDLNLTVQAQPLYDLIEWHPYWKGFRGDQNGGGESQAESGPTFDVSAVLRSAAYGMVIDGARQGVDGASVTLTDQSDGSSRGVTTSAADGYWLTAAPFACPGVGVLAKGEKEGRDNTTAYSSPARFLQRFIFVITEPAGGGAFLCSDKSRSLFVHAHQESRVRALSHAPSSSWRAIRISPDYPVKALPSGAVSGRQGDLVFVALLEDDSWRVYRSSSIGFDGVEIMPLPASIKAAVVAHDNARGVWLLVTSDDAGLSVRRANDLGAGFGAASPVQAGGPQLQGEILSAAVDERSGTLALAVRAADDSTSIYYSTDLAKTAVAVSIT
jgi:hypothetical protein